MLCLLGIIACVAILVTNYKLPEEYSLAISQAMTQSLTVWHMLQSAPAPYVQDVVLVYILSLLCGTLLVEVSKP